MGQRFHPPMLWGRPRSYVLELVDGSIRTTHAGCWRSTPDCFPLQRDVAPVEFDSCFAPAPRRRSLGRGMGTQCWTAISLHCFGGRETIAYFQVISRNRWGGRHVRTRGYTNNSGLECLEVSMERHRHRIGMQRRPRGGRNVEGGLGRKFPVRLTHRRRRKSSSGSANEKIIWSLVKVSSQSWISQIIAFVCAFKKF